MRSTRLDECGCGEIRLKRQRWDQFQNPFASTGSWQLSRTKKARFSWNHSLLWQLIGYFEALDKDPVSWRSGKSWRSAKNNIFGILSVAPVSKEFSLASLQSWSLIVNKTSTNWKWQTKRVQTFLFSWWGLIRPYWDWTRKNATASSTSTFLNNFVVVLVPCFCSCFSCCFSSLFCVYLVIIY